MIKEKLIYLCIVVTLLTPISIVSYLNFSSLKEQAIMFFDYNEKKLVDTDVIKNYNEDFPNISATTLPIKEMKLRYYIRNKKYDSLLDILKKEKSANPFIGFRESIIAEIYSEKGTLDSAIKYSEISFQKLPNNIANSTFLISLYRIKRDSLAILSTFNRVPFKDKRVIKSYINGISEVSNFKDIEVLKVIDSISSMDKDKDWEELKYIVLVGKDNLIGSSENSLIGDNYFEKNDIDQAILYYKKAIDFNRYNPIIHENLGICYLKKEDYIQSIKSLNISIDSLNSKRQKSYFFRAVSQIALGNFEDACEDLVIPIKKNFKGANELFTLYCKN